MVGLTMFDSLWLLFALPAFGALIVLFTGRWLSQKVVGWIASAAVLGAFTALRDLGVPATVTGWLMCTDNMPSGTAVKLGKMRKKERKDK